MDLREIDTSSSQGNWGTSVECIAGTQSEWCNNMRFCKCLVHAHAVTVLTGFIPQYWKTQEDNLNQIRQLA